MTLMGAPPARSGPVLFWTGTRVLAFGGGVAGGGIYSPCADSWTAMADLAVNLAGASMNDFAGGGQLLFYTPAIAGLPASTPTLGAYDYWKNTWRALSTAGAIAAQAQAVVSTDLGLIAWGGAAAQSAAAQLPYAGTNTGAAYDAAMDRWTAISAAGAPSARVGAGNALWTGHGLAVWGGSRADSIAGPGGSIVDCWRGAYDECGRLADGAIYDPKTDHWTPMAAAGAPSARADHVLAWTGTRVLAWGGDAYVVTNGQPKWTVFVDGGLYDPAAAAWSPMAAAPFDASHAAGPALWTGDRLVVLDSKGTGAAGWIYDSRTDAWAPISAPVRPLNCIGAASVQAGAIVRGGCGSGAQQTVARLDPVANQWTVVDLPANVPGQPGVLWTGARWIVWGGSRAGPTPPNPCVNAQPGVPCDAPGPMQIPSNEGWTLVP
jgi:hypothetical protein